jgi:hypothetical protein
MVTNAHLLGQLLRPTRVPDFLPGPYQRLRRTADLVFGGGYANRQAHCTNGAVNPDAHGR